MEDIIRQIISNAIIAYAPSNIYRDMLNSIWIDKAVDELCELFGNQYALNDVIKLLEQSLGYHCDKPNCDHNLKEAIKVLKSTKKDE